MEWIQTESAIIKKDEIVGLQFTEGEKRENDFTLTVILRGGGNLRVFGGDALKVWTDFKNEVDNPVSLPPRKSTSGTY